MKCEVCKKEFELKKENKYIVQNVSVSGLFNRNYYDAFDCPHCGCQNITNVRYLEVDADKEIQCLDGVNEDVE